MTVRSILAEKDGDIYTMGPDASVAEICNELTRRRIGAVVIVDGDTLAGIVSERDIVHVLARLGAAALDQTARDIMTSPVETCTPGDTIQDVMQRMTTGRFRHFPVVVEGRLTALVSIGDVVKHRIAQAEREAAAIRDYIATG